MSVIWIFLDGVGYGENDPVRNPWAGVRGETLIAVRDRPPSYPGVVWRPLDAQLGVEGLPQSATGTTALLTGINAPAEIGKHLSGFPNKALRRIIDQHSIYLQALNHNLRPTFANAYSDAYFRRPMSRQSVTTHAVRAAGLPFRMMDDYRNGLAVFHDLTGELIRAQGNEGRLEAPGSVISRRVSRYLKNPDTFIKHFSDADLPLITPEEGGDRIASLAAQYDLVIFEYVKTDLAGHLQQLEWAGSVVSEIMVFFRRILERLDLKRDTLLVASDHGNSEDLSIKSHTFNPVPAVAVGPGAEALLEGCVRITDLASRVMEFLSSSD